MLKPPALVIGLLSLGLLVSSPVVASTLSQTVHFPEANADTLFELYATAEGHTQITGLPVAFKSADGADTDKAEVGGVLDAFCFEPGKCGLNARILDISSANGVHTITLSWWNFDWVSAIDPGDLTVEGRGAPDSTVVMTFRDTLRGAQIELVHVNVPDFKVRIPNPDKTEELGYLSTIVNTHWNTLYWDGFRRVVAQ
ncbi:MAG: hypothetical protein ABJN26_25410 [Stappiaceae bacterium]